MEQCFRSGQLAGQLKKKSHQSYRRAIRIQLQVRTWQLKASTCSFERQKHAGALPRRRCAWGAGFALTMPEAAETPQNSAQEPNRQRTTSNAGSHGAAAVPGPPAHAGAGGVCWLCGGKGREGSGGCAGDAGGKVLLW